MNISAEEKTELVDRFGKNKQDTGSPEVQVAILSKRIAALTEHLKVHAKDFHTRRGLLVLVGKRRRLLRYLQKRSQERYQTVIAALGLRR